MIIKDYVAIDLEMTGLSARRDSILEIGAVRVKDKKVEDTYQALIHPHLELSEEVTKLTGITSEMAQQGREMDEVFPEIMEFCEGAVLLGHNVIFDYGFLKQAALNRNMKFEHQGVDTLKLARKLLPPEEKKTLQLLCDQYQIRRERKHRALDDALAARELYEIFEAEYEARRPEIFVPCPLVYKAKKQSPATKRQIKHLRELAEYHKIALQVSWDTLTKNEASRKIDRIIAQYGKLPKRGSEAPMDHGSAMGRLLGQCSDERIAKF